jgi:lipopolysaccharide/colanic/teichoic acid biosynthesis glycosyltransferase
VELGALTGERVLPTAPADCRGFASSKEQARLRIYLTLVVIDLVCLTIGFLVAGLLRTGHVAHWTSLELIAVMIPTFLGVALNNGAYSLEALKRPGDGIAKAWQAVLFSLAAVLFMFYYLKVTTDYSRLIFGIGSALAMALVAVSRWSFGNWVGKACDWSFENTLLVIDEAPVMPQPGDIALFADQAGLSPTCDDPVVLDRLARLTKHCERFVVACPAERRAAWAQTLRGCAIDVEIVVPELCDIGAVELRTFHAQRTLLVSTGPMALQDRALKRLLDLTIAISAIVMFGPVLLAIAIMIKLESSGPILFFQDRVGLNNKIFKLMKFRSMRADLTDWNGSRSISRGDDRVTPFGSFLRKTSLDELPQLFNVLIGDMSIVGPRPHALGSTAEDLLFWHIDSRYFHRHAIKPGMTGLAQVRGYRGPTVRKVDLTNRLQADLEYLSGWTVWKDIRIILGTFKVISGGNAY